MTRRWRCSTSSRGMMQGGGLGTNELLEKGRLLDKMGRFDEAFAAFDAGKRKGRRAKR